MMSGIFSLFKGAKADAKNSALKEVKTKPKADIQDNEGNFTGLKNPDTENKRPNKSNFTDWAFTTTPFKALRFAGSWLFSGVFVAGMAAGMTAWLIAFIGKTFDTVVLDKFFEDKLKADPGWTQRMEEASDFVYWCAFKGGLLAPAITVGNFFQSGSAKYLAESGRDHSRFEEADDLIDALKRNREDLSNERNKTSLSELPEQEELVRKDLEKDSLTQEEFELKLEEKEKNIKYSGSYADLSDINNNLEKEVLFKGKDNTEGSIDNSIDEVKHEKIISKNNIEELKNAVPKEKMEETTSQQNKVKPETPDPETIPSTGIPLSNNNKEIEHQ